MLIEKVEALTMGSRELECEIPVALGIFRIELNDRSGTTDYVRIRPGRALYPARGGTQLVPDYTTSIDDLHHLILQELPGWTAALDLGALTSGETRYRAGLTSSDGSETCDGHGITPAIALLAAILRAIEWKNGQARN